MTAEAGASTNPDADVVTTADAEGVRTITLNRPASYNALSVALKERLLAELTAAARDDDVRAVVLTGAGAAFCAGQDLKEHVNLLLADDPAPLRTVSEHYNPIATAIATMPKPIIAAVNGSAAGAGAAFAYAADLRIASSSANFVMAFAGVGLGSDSGASWTLQRLVGYGRALELMLLGRKVHAEEAARIGLVSEVVDDGEVVSRAQQVAAQLAAGPGVAYRKIKETLAAASGSTFTEALAAEEAAQAELGATADHREAVDAFVNKRKPTFSGQ
ncbi:enoyl-CoA hydratase-related protein [Haloechinothrix sp. LS1_15]|uniref:enoyl-CoA hydratase-related protein n=1 Tax=Haloechinothrix sp. LS1_15 TaxID=2652248 RepID=UPI00294B4C1E|nr:enoyl-CoA hydratase-related protein [Haloechinothrix sp. LS1_15]